jgi:SARP family transcriptional regulator, regulator of embCAB operon
MVLLDMFRDALDQFFVRAAAQDLPAFAVDQFAHRVSPVVGAAGIMRRRTISKIGETLASGAETRIHLCGQLTVRLRGRRVEEELPGRQGRMLFAYLAAHRLRATPRPLLLEVLWPEAQPAAAESALAALLAKLRRVVGETTLTGRQELRLVLPDDAWIDLDAAADGLHRAESAVGARDWTRAWAPARVAMHIAERGFMPGYEARWMEPIRQRLAATLVRAHECMAESGLGIGGAETRNAERAAQRLVELAPLNEPGYRLLMQALAARGNVADALLVYERLRAVMREELGAAPGALTQALHRKILTGAP